MSGHKTYFNWSSGKDSALALYYLQQDANYNVEYLLTSVNAHYERVTMHGLRTDLLMKQVNELGLASGTVNLPEMPSNDEYEKLLGAEVQRLKHSGFEFAGFGDIFLEDLRNYRENQLARLDVRAVFPLWKRDTRQLIHDFLGSGFKAITVCVNSNLLDNSYAGRISTRISSTACLKTSIPVERMASSIVFALLARSSGTPSIFRLAK
jgi:diphthamide synthase (EF-2-diphthine--ammonia ligase)